MTQFTEEEKTIRRIERRFSKGVVQYGLIEEGDKILIGLSGGKIRWRLWNCWGDAHVSINLAFLSLPSM